jgi:drug/metabolite transporter (DMT)-like permease
MPVSADRYRLLLLAAAILFSTGGAAIKAATLTSWQIASFRSAIAAVVLFGCLPQARKGWSWRVWPVGVTYAATLVLFVLATRLTTAANAIYLQSTAPLYVIVLGPVLLREIPRRADILFVASIALGMSLFFTVTEPAAASAPDPRLGNLLAAGTGLSWACTVTGLRWLGHHRKESAATATVVAGNLIGCLATLPMALPVTAVSLADVLVVGYLGVFQIGLAYFFVATAIRHVPAFEATAILLVEPALNPVWAWLIQGERPAPASIAGGAIILLATAIKTWWQTRAD